MQNPNQLRKRAAARTARHSGFALVIAILLMAMMVLLLISLTTLTRVETELSTQKKQSSIARQNALFALNVAIGQLQKYAGPDQRTTASANIDATLANTTTANGNWIGVYGNAAPIDYAEKPSTVAETITSYANAKGSQAVLLNWLVSGNENVNFTPENDVAADGHILNAPNAFSFLPTSAVDLTQVNAKPDPNDTQVLLMGAGTASSTEDFVAAPLVDIEDGDAATTTGRYAWWIGDEGAKANATLDMADANNYDKAFVAAQRSAIELIDKAGADRFDPDTLIADNFNPNSSALPLLNSLNELSFLATNDSDAMINAMRANPHAITIHSESLLVDSYAGGLKKDLSALLTTEVTTPADTDYIFTPDTDDANDTFAVPTWGALRSFVQTTVPNTGGLEPRVPTTTDVGVAPVLTYFSLGMRYYAPSARVPGSPIRLALMPLVVLWNPYTTPINAHTYEIGINRRYRAWYQLQVYNDGTGEWEHKEAVNFGSGASLSQYPTESYVRFQIDCPEIPPGASLIFTLQNDQSGVAYDADRNGPANNILTNGLYAAGHVYLDFGSNTARFEADEVDAQFRVSGSRMVDPVTDSFGMSGGEVAVYFGEAMQQAPRGYDTSDNNDKQWHQTITRLSPAQDSNNNLHNNRNEFLQSPAPLDDYLVQPSSVMYVERNFAAAPPSSPIFPDVRWIAQGNPRSLYITESEGDSSVNPSNFSAGGGMESPWMTFNAETSGKRASAGTSLDSVTDIVDATLFEFRSENMPLMSLGQLQHANLSYINTYPAYPIGNSLADYHFLDNRGEVRVVYDGASGLVTPSDKITSYYDISWLLNRALWDRYFVSTIPYEGTGISTDTNVSPIPSELPNPRIAENGRLNDEDLRDAELAASGLSLKGGFNINSTSEQAWRAILGGLNQLPYDPVADESSAVELGSALPRFSRPTEAPDVDNSQAWAWQGYRQLTDEQIAELAKNIVTEIRNRGPFVSLADFINRRLTDNPDTVIDERFKGALQAAIDATMSGTPAINRGEDLAYGNSGTNPFHHPSADLPNYRGNKFDLELMQGYEGTPDGEVPYGSTSAFAPQFLTQADVLSAIGSALTARSDTFVIRTYGEAINPLTQETESRAWCEAVVQRQIDYIDADANSPEDNLNNLNQQNRLFGRKFNIISFRWLTPEEI
ncbi:hypothetical protein [Cerasicoccus fimbriatus]|uniref:hypothetical protein n=1 Tax=Cerasicoccus fimbriatus TaxID=3014554 RepID=UPI0022B489BD|nr:hypothetical protein [Cerasicoccus sp. TK19100]